MNILVVNGPGKLDNGKEVILFPSRWDSAVDHASFAYYPYELAYLSTLLKRELPNDRVTMLDGNLSKWGPDRYAAEIVSHDPDVVITECSALTYPTMTGIMRRVKVLRPSSWMLTGPYGTSDAQPAYNDGWSSVIAGEYEHKVLALIRYGDTPGGYVDLDWLPNPEDEDISRIHYREMSDPFPGMIQVYPTRGCPMPCSFCAVPTYYGGHGNSKGSHRGRNPDSVCDELEYLTGKYPQMRGAFFNDENHNSNVRWLEKFANTLIDRGLDRLHYDAMCGYWTFTAPLVELLARAGYCQIRIGIESVSRDVHKQIGKYIHNERIEAFMGWCKSNGIAVYGTFMIGSPGSTEESDLATIDAIHRWEAHGKLARKQVSTATPQPGTPFHAQAIREGWLVTDDLNLYDGTTAVLNYPDYPAHRIQAVRGMA